MRNTKRDIQRILFLLLAAFLSAGGLAAFMLYFYSPNDRYIAGQTLLAPEIMHQINLLDGHPLTGQKVRFIFDQTEFSYFDSHTHHAVQVNVPAAAYEQFYQLVASDQSIKTLEDKIKQTFNEPHPALLTTHLQTEKKGTSSATKIFQIVQFSPSDYFRVRLHGDQQEEWAYFYHKGIYQKIRQLFSLYTQTN